MLGSGFRRAFSRFGSSSDRLDQGPTDELIRKDKQKAGAQPESFVSEEGVIYPSTSTSNPWRERTSSSGGKQTPAVDPHVGKHLPRIPIPPNEAISHTGLFEGIPHLTSAVADSLKADLEPVVVDSDKASSGLLLDKLATRNLSSKDDATPNPDPLDDRGRTNQRRTFLDRGLVALSLAESSVSNSTDDSSTRSEGTEKADSTEQDTFDSFLPEPAPPEATLESSLSNIQEPKPSAEQDSDMQETGPRRNKTSFSSFLHKLATVPVTQPISDDFSSSAQRAAVQDYPLSTDLPSPRGPDRSTNRRLPESTATSTSTSTPTSLSPSPLYDDDQEKKKRRKRPQNTFLMLQPIVESGDNLSPPPSKPSSSGFTPSTLGVDSSFARRMEETGRLRRLQSQQNIASSSSSSGGLKPLILSPKAPQSPPALEKPALNGNAHSKTRSEGDVLTPRSAVNVSLPPSFKNAQTKVNELGNSDDQDALHEFLERTVRELEEAQREAARIKAQSNLDKLRLEEQLKDANEEVLALQKENQLQKTEIASFEKQLKNKERDVLRLSMEKQNWQEQLDTMHHRLNQAERQIRCLDHLTRAKLDARMEGAYGPTRRAKIASPSKEPSLEVIGALGALNEEILQTANLLVENLEQTKSAYPTSEDTTLARTTLGNKVTTMIQAQAADHSKGFRFLLMQVVLEVFMVHWCTDIIEGWYPKQQSFADLLVEMNSKTVTSPAALRADCGKVKLIQTSTTTTVTMRFPEWAADILRDLGGILLVAGLRMRPNRASLFTSKLLSLVKMAYDVRTALAEKDICGNLDLSVVGPDLPFQPKWMEEAHAMSRHQLGTTMQMEPIAGTCGMGLKRLEVKKSNTFQQDQTVVLKPRVVLARVLDESP